MWVFLSKCRQQVWTKSSSAVWQSSAWTHTLHRCMTKRALVLLWVTCNGFNGKHMPSWKKIETSQMEKNLRELAIPSWTWKKLSVENLHFSTVRGIEEGKHLKTETESKVIRGIIFIQNQCTFRQVRGEFLWVLGIALLWHGWIQRLKWHRRSLKNLLEPIYKTQGLRCSMVMVVWSIHSFGVMCNMNVNSEPKI